MYKEASQTNLIITNESNHLHQYKMPVFYSLICKCHEYQTVYIHEYRYATQQTAIEKGYNPKQLREIENKLNKKILNFSRPK